MDDAVTLMTIHMAKGLEFKNVFVVGMEEDLFPSQMMLSSRADLEEERRLFYVAITRAEQHLFLSYALNRYRYGRLKTCEPSRFLSDIDTTYLQAKAASTKAFCKANRPSTLIRFQTKRHEQFNSRQQGGTSQIRLWEGNKDGRGWCQQEGHH